MPELLNSVGEKPTNQRQTISVQADILNVASAHALVNLWLPSPVKI